MEHAAQEVGTLYEEAPMKFSELVRMLDEAGFRIVKEKGSVRYYARDGWSRLVRVDYHKSREVPTGTLHAIMKAAGIRRPKR